jgi:hypothetical protein
MKVNVQLKDEVSLFVNEYYCNQYACLISGSFVEGLNNEFSDVDVIVFARDRNIVFNETLLYKVLKIQVIVIPVQNVADILWVDYLTCKGAFINMISKGVIVFDCNNFLKHLISHTKELELLGGRNLTDREVYMSKVKITSLLFDIMGGKNVDELLFSITELLDLITVFKLKINKYWCGEGKYRMKQIKKLDREFEARLILSVKEIYANKNKAPLISLTKELLDQHGGLLPYYSTANSLSKVSDDYLIIEIENDLNLKRIKKTIKGLSEFAKQIISQKINYYFFSSKSATVDKEEQNIYMVIETDKSFINDYLIDRLSFLVENREDLSKLSFPFQFDLIYRFSTKSIYSAVAPLFHKTSGFITEKPNRIFNTSFQIEFSLQFMQKIKNIWFKNNSQAFIAFNEYLLNCWIPEVYDNGVSFKTTDLINSKKNILLKFHTLYNDQKKELLQHYTSEKSADKSFFELLTTINEISDFDNIPLHQTYLVPNNVKDINIKQWSLYRETLFTLFAAVFIDNRFLSYIPFVIKKIELND